MKKVKALIVDDEFDARSLMRNFIENYCPEVELIDEAEDVESAVKIITENKIDLVFLDIEMPNKNGFALFDYFNKPDFETIFCTAYSQYAIKAFEVSAVDYILKPVGISNLKEAIKKATEKLSRNIRFNNIAILKENLSENKIKKIGIHIGNSIVFMDLEDIFYFEADGSYTIIHHKNGNDLTVKKLKHFEDLLSSDTRFFRIHRSYFANITLIKKYSKKDGASIAYDNNIPLPVAQKKKEEFEEFMLINHIVQ